MLLYNLFFNSKLKFSLFFLRLRLRNRRFLRVYYLLGQFPVDLVQVLFKIPYPRFPRVTVCNIEQGFLVILYLIFFKPVFLKAFGYKVAFGYFKLFLIDVSGKLNNLHPVNQRVWNGIQGIGGYDKKHVGNVKRYIKIVIAEIGILFRVKDFKKGAGRITLEALAHFVDLVDHKDRVFCFYDFEPLYNLARKSAYVSPAVALNFRLIPHAAH
jgi:hypothetical protein